MTTESIALSGAAKILKKPLDDVYELGKSKFKSKLDKWKANKNINGLYKRIASVQNVKTIWQIDKEVNLKKFYYPSKLIIDGNLKTISRINQIPDEANIVIQGTVGQGKSIFLRYLCSQELRCGQRIPIFFELRKTQKGKTLKQHLSDVLDSWGFDVTDDLFDFFADSGKFCFLLDGFDELDPSLIITIITELELFSEKYPNLRIVVTSRPDSGIDKSAYFRVYNLAPLKNKDHEAILKKLIINDDQAQNILIALTASSIKINELLTTPLMMTLLVLIYKAEQKIPEQFSEFYENLFQILLLRHDKSKPGYVRIKNCPVNERKLQDIFETFCFLASKESLTIMNYEKAHLLADNAIQQTNIKCDSSDFIKDISKIVCLFIEEGFDYHFIHRSVREYHAANFIKKRPDEFAIKFYGAMQNNEYLKWKQELDFLSQVDEYRFTKYFLIPHALITLNILESHKNITDLDKIEELKNYIIGLDENTMRVNHGRGINLYNSYLFDDNNTLSSIIFDYFINKFSIISDKDFLAQSFIKDIQKTARLTDAYGRMTYEISALDLIKITGSAQDVLDIVRKRYNNFILQYEERCIFVENENKKNELLNF